MQVECKCKDWQHAMPQINAAQTSYAVHIYGKPYTGKTFRFCPWCRKVLKKVKTDKESSTRK